MKRLFLSTICLFAAFMMFAQNPQAKKPTLMILPSDNWCTQRYFTTTFQNQGLTVRVPDYQLAFQEDAEIGGVISKVGEMLTAYGYSLKDAEMEIKNLAVRTGEDNVTMSKTSGASLVESPLDMLKRRVKADIIIQLGWQVNKEAAGKSVTFTMEAFDSYTSKRVATASGTSAASDDIVPRLLEQAIQEKIAPFDFQMNQYFQSLFMNGREIIMTVRCWDSWENDLETEYNGNELTDCIQDWLAENTVNGAFNLTDGTESFLQFEQVRIPMFNDKGRAMDARMFGTALRKHLQEEPYFITSKVMVRGLGEVILVLGEK